MQARLAVSVLIAVLCSVPLCARAQQYDPEALLPLNATCADIDAVNFVCVDVGMGCNDTAGALVQATAKQPVYVCREGLNCQVPPPGFPASSPFQCAVTARIGELCSCTALDENCAALGCYEPNYGVTCLNALCRGVNVFGPGEPASFNAKGACDRSSNAPYPNGGCVQQAVIAESLICDSATSTCSSVAIGDSCADTRNDWCEYDAYCHTGSATCVLRQLSNGAACNSTAECGPLLHCVPSGTCRAWFSGHAGDSCSVSEDCAVDFYCASDAKCAPAPALSACDAPSDVCTADAACVCDGGKGECETDATTAEHLKEWTALVTCVSEHRCFPVTPAGGAPASVAQLSFFPGGCYDTFCRKEWLALTDALVPCPSAASALAPLLLAVAALVAALL